MGLRGFLDSIRGGCCVAGRTTMTCRSVAHARVDLDGRVLGEFVGTEFRADLVSANVGDGRHGFIYPFPSSGKARRRRSRCGYADTGALVGNGERLVANDEISAAPICSGSALARGMWQPSAIVLDPQRGSSRDGDFPLRMPMDFAITHNGRPLELVSRALSRSPRAASGFRTAWAPTSSAHAAPPSTATTHPRASCVRVRGSADASAVQSVSHDVHVAPSSGARAGPCAA